MRHVLGHLIALPHLRIASLDATQAGGRGNDADENAACAQAAIAFAKRHAELSDALNPPLGPSGPNQES